ncbi:MAG: class I tRNA ligase family protein, partial [bacterium]|nr:class I tRNA ligase family protein [bacterium]
DWCISRQIWWGHKIPLEGVDDVLDTWFSSALWPFATLGWPDKESPDLKEFFPTQTLSTARDIINLWVARMIFSSYEFMGQKPFSDVVIHPTILTKDGRRMSKSLGTGIDPIGLIEKYGADATRFGLIYQMMGGQDVHFNEDAILAGKKFANKLWNIARFVLQNTDGKFKDEKPPFADDDLTEENKEILKKLEETIVSANRDIKEYKLGHALHLIYDFIWREFADKYIEYSKQNKSERTDEILKHILIEILKLLHPPLCLSSRRKSGVCCRRNPPRHPKPRRGKTC